MNGRNWGEKGKLEQKMPHCFSMVNPGNESIKSTSGGKNDRRVFSPKLDFFFRTNSHVTYDMFL